MIKLINVNKSYGPKAVSLSNINIHIKKGEFVFITGVSGSGKTTLLKLLYGEERPTSGQALINGKNINTLKRSEIPYLRRRVGVVFQDFRLLEGRSIFENVAIPLEVSGIPAADIVKKVHSVLSTVRLHHRMDEKVSSLSAGEQQKVAVARAVINDPLILLADEPTGSLDVKAGEEILDILKMINAKGTTVVFATHNRALIKDGRVITMEKGRVFS